MHYDQRLQVTDTQKGSSILSSPPATPKLMYTRSSQRSKRKQCNVTYRIVFKALCTRIVTRGLSPAQDGCYVVTVVKHDRSYMKEVCLVLS